MKRFAFDKSRRLLKNAQFQYAYRRGQSYPSHAMVLVVAKSRGRTRAGFSVGKKVGNSVKRSRAKRLLRESYRLMAYRLRNGKSLVFIARQVLLEMPFAQIQRTMEQLLRKACCVLVDADETSSPKDTQRV